MGLFEHFPYTNFHGLNLDWLLAKYKELDGDVKALKEYVSTFVDDQLVPIVEAKLDEMVENGELDEILRRMEVIDYVTPQMYGAVGDGLTDDTEAFQAAVDSGKAVCLLMTSMYKLTDTIHLRGRHLETASRERQNRIIFSKAPMEYNSPSPQIVVEFTDNTHPIFSIEASAYKFYNVNIECKNGPGDSAAIDLTCFRTNMIGDPNVDFCILNCRFNRAYYLIDLTGRGIKMDGCYAYRCYHLIDIKWEGDPESGTYHSDYAGQRGIVFENNRFHSFPGGPFIHLDTDAHGFGARFVNNNFDRGRGNLAIFDGKPINWIMTGNTFNGLTGSGGTGKDGLLEFRAGAEGFTFSNNNVWQLPQASEGSFTNMIYFAPADDTVVGLNVIGNMVNELDDGCLIKTLNEAGVTPSVALYSCNISNNTVSIINTTDTVAQAILRASVAALQNCVIANNIIGDKTGTAALYAVYCAGNHTLDYCKIIGNVVPGSTTTFGGTGTETLTGCLIDDDLITP